MALKPTEREFKHIIIHSSATLEGAPITAKNINEWHKQRGFAGIGYNFVIDIDGHVELGRTLGINGAHCVSHGRNLDSIGVCYVGGLSKNSEPSDTRTEAQKIALAAVLQTLKAVWPNAEISGHRDWACTICPSFDAKNAYSNITGDTLL